MSVQAGLWLLLLLLLSANAATGPPSTAEEKLDSSQDLIPVLPLPGSDGGKMEKDTAPSSSSQISGSILGSSQHLSEHLPCVDEQQPPPEALGSFLLALREGWNKRSEVGKKELARFGICSHSDSQQRHQFPALLMLGQRAHEEHNDPGYFHTKKEHWDVEESGKFTLTLHLTKPCKDYQQSTLGSITLLFFVGSINTEEMNLKFSSRALQPDKQTVCVSKNTQFLALTADQAQIFNHGQLKLRIVIDRQSDSGQKMGLADLQAMLVRKEARTSVPLSPVVLFFTHSSNCELEAPPSNQTFFFLCELQEFLNKVLPQEDPILSAEEEATVSQDVLHSLPPLSLGASSSASFLLELINYSGPTAFLFPRQSLGMQNHRVELTLNAALLSVLRQRLEEALAQIRTEDAGRSVMDKLQTLTALTTLPGDREGAAGSESPGEVQYRAFLLLKALQTVLGVWAEERAQRAARADEESLIKPSHCRLQSLTVSLVKYLFEPSRANINNCEGACDFPLPTGTNHAILLNSHLQSGHPLNRTLCCVPVAYDELPVIELDGSSATISYKSNMIAKKCECR